MTQAELDSMADRAGLLPRERTVWQAAEKGEPLAVLVEHWPSGPLPKRCRERRLARARRINYAKLLLRDAWSKLDRAFPGWRHAGLREAKDILVCAKNKVIHTDHATLAEEAGLREWLEFEAAPDPGLHPVLVSASDLLGSRRSQGIRALDNK